MADTLEGKLKEEVLRNEKLEEGAGSYDQNELSRADEQWDAPGEADVALINFDVSNTGSEFQESDHAPSVVSSGDGAIQRNHAIKDSSGKALLTQLRDESNSDGRALPVGSTMVEVSRGQDDSVVGIELPVRTLEQEYIESGIKEYLAQGDATVRTGNVGRRARVRTKKSTGRDLREKGRLRGSVRNSEMADVVNPSGDEESAKLRREPTSESRSKKERTAGDDPRSMQSGNDQGPEGSTGRRPSANSHWSWTWVHQRGRGSEPYRPYIYPSEPVAQSSGQVVEGLYIGRKMVLTPQHWAQQHPYAELLDSRYYYPAAPRHRIESYLQSEAYQPSHTYEKGYRPQFRPLPIYPEYQYGPQSHHPYYHYQDSDESQLQSQPQPTAAPQHPALPGHGIPSSNQSLPGPILFPTPAVAK